MNQTPLTPEQLASMIDHTALKPETTRAQIRQLCEEARQFNFVAVCVAPLWIDFAVHQLSGSPVKVATVVGFPHGNTLTDVKAFETTQAIERGAQEVDMVIPVGTLKCKDTDAVLEDIGAVVESARSKPGLVVKVILETALLTDEEKVSACHLAAEAGADFVKTSTGFSSGGATVADVTLMRRTVGDRLGVKAAGGIRDLATARAMIEAGANRIGCSASLAIMQELAADLNAG
ncbi:MAG: deoxyribose-phosphate aldolase [Abitibacteriaceae bacterium]|nr:deoxyribose-phosphate aldolase [Abditibacteriaceae bacterium]